MPYAAASLILDFSFPLATLGIGATRPKVDRLAWYYPPAGLNVKLSMESTVGKAPEKPAAPRWVPLGGLAGIRY
jgi:hypothetical protein